MVDRFGTGVDVFYRPDDERHFVVTTEIAISDQFFGWIAGCRKMAKIVSPPDVVADFQNFLDDIYAQGNNGTDLPNVVCGIVIGFCT